MDSSEDSSEDEMITASRKCRKLTASVAAIATGALMAFSTIPLEPPRIGNCRNSRPEALQYVRSWDDDMFRRQFRICREDFGELLLKINPLIRRNEAKAQNSSGSSICPEMRLMLNLRILAGAKYLDMIWYRVSMDHVQGYVHDCLLAVNSVLEKKSLISSKFEVFTASSKI
jgi:hypothetical protein